MDRRALLRDGGLLLLALVTLVAVAFVVLRDDAPDTSGAVTIAPAPSASASAAPDAVRALFFGAELWTGSPSPATLTGQRLGWQATVDALPGSGFVAGSRLVERVPIALRGRTADVVILSSTSAPAEGADLRRLAGNAQYVVNEISDALPEARLVLIGPGATTDDAVAQRDVLLRVAARFGVMFIDPAGSGYLDGIDGVAADGSLTPAGAARFAERLARDLAIVLPPTLLPASPAR